MTDRPIPSKERSLAERLDRILRDPYVANRAMAQTIREAREALSGVTVETTGLTAVSHGSYQKQDETKFAGYEQRLPTESSGAPKVSGPSSHHEVDGDSTIRGADWYARIGKALMTKLLREHPEVEWEKVGCDDIAGFISESPSSPVETSGMQTGITARGRAEREAHDKRLSGKASADDVCRECGVELVADNCDKCGAENGKGDGA